jgi:hypothetical protein
MIVATPYQVLSFSSETFPKIKTFSETFPMKIAKASIYYESRSFIFTNDFEFGLNQLTDAPNYRF